MGRKSQTAEQERLRTDRQLFEKYANRLSEEQFKQQPGGKWSVAEVMQHLYLSARPVTRLLTGPHNVLAQWGTPEAPSRTYDEVAATYRQVLATGIKAPAMAVPRPDDMQANKTVIIERFTGIYQALVDALGQWSEHELDAYTIPHPVLGNLTVQEMLHFTSAHTRHHLRLLPTA